MEQHTIRQRRFGSLSARRKQKDADATKMYETSNEATMLSETRRGSDAEMSNTDSTASSPSSTPEINASTSVESLSDMSVTTPSGISVMVSDMKKKNHLSDIMSKAPELHLTMPSMAQHKPSTSPRPVLAPSLNKPSDFSFDWYSRVNATPELDDIEVFEVSEAAWSPIEVATPITYIRPNRPSMVSIFHILDKGSDKDARKSLQPKPDVPSRNPGRSIPDKRLSTLSSRSGFVAGEATRFEIPDLPDNALTMISNASQTDLSLAARQPEPAIKRQKSSIALLSKALKYGHSRMTSRTQPTSPVSSLSRPQSQHSVLSPTPGPEPTSRLPPTASARPQPSPSRHVGSKPTSARPQTAVPRTSPPSVPVDVTALPPCDDNISHRNSTVLGSPSPLLDYPSRKKSISTLRSRSDSIGHALKSMATSNSASKAKGRNIARDALSSPTLPTSTVSMTGQKISIDLSTFPTPPTPSQPLKSRGSVVSFSRPIRSSSIPLLGLGVTMN